MAGRVAGDVHGLERDPGEVERLVAGEQHVRLVRADRDAGVVLGGPGEHRRLDLGDVHRRAGRLGEVGDRADVVVVRVGEQDRACSAAPIRASSSRSVAASPPGSTTTASAAPRSARTT